MQARDWQPPQTFLYLLKRAHLTSRALADEALAEVGISVAQYSLLRRLEEEPALSGAELARRSFVSAPTINGLLNGLEQAGLIERFPDPDGGRCVLARLTAAGTRKVAAAHDPISRLEKRLLDGVDGAALIGALTTVIDNEVAAGVSL